MLHDSIEFNLLIKSNFSFQRCRWMWFVYLWPFPRRNSAVQKLCNPFWASDRFQDMCTLDSRYLDASSGSSSQVSVMEKDAICRRQRKQWVFNAKKRSFLSTILHSYLPSYFLEFNVPAGHEERRVKRIRTRKTKREKRRRYEEREEEI